VPAFAVELLRLLDLGIDRRGRRSRGRRLGEDAGTHSGGEKEMGGGFHRGQIMTQAGVVQRKTAVGLTAHLPIL
jgi:hypothetical protein